MRGYIKNEDGQIDRTPEYAHYWKHGAGGFKSNVGDFARWAQALVSGELVSVASHQQMWTAQKTKQGESTQWGLGFMIENQNGLKVSHGGKQREATTRLVVYPQARHGVVVMCNCEYAAVGAISTAVYSALNQR